MLVVRASTLITSEGCGALAAPERRQHGGHHHSRFVPGLAKRGFVIFNHVEQRHRGDHPHAAVGRLHMIRNLRLVHVERQ